MRRPFVDPPLSVKFGLLSMSTPPTARFTLVFGGICGLGIGTVHMLRAGCGDGGRGYVQNTVVPLLLPCVVSFYPVPGTFEML